MTTEKAADLAFELEDVGTTIEEAMAVLWWGRWHGSF
jgi:hypothetical protein